LRAIRKGKEQFKEGEISIRTLLEVDIFYLTKWLMDPVVLGFFPMSNLSEVQDASKIWLYYARKSLAFTAEIDNVPMGMAILYVNTFEKLRYQSLFAIVVGEEYRGKGVGLKLIQHLIKEARDTYGMTLLHLEVYHGNPAINLYKRLGFVEYGKHERFLKEADGTYQAKVLMQLDLTKTR
jgi:ribosomal protein S18 acetylase RimI-like enzyme